MSLDNDTLINAQSYLSILRRQERELLVLDSLVQHPMQLLYHSMTEEEKTEAIGLLSRMNLELGGLSEKFLWMLRSERSSKTASMTSPSSGDPSASK